MPTTVLVIPCYNEAGRLPAARFLAHTRQHGDTGFVFVDDGSTDRTRAVIEELAAHNPALLRSVHLKRNQGKAEAVRAGIREAEAMQPEYVGYWDADLSTPLEALAGFVELYRRTPDKVMLSGARVRLMGRHIERRAIRHCLGRAFALAVTALLDIRMYDTQCGAKLFRSTPETHALFAEPFRSPWLFDLELILRLRRRADVPVESLIREVPLEEWRDVSGSKISYPYFLWALFDLAALRFRYRR